MRHHLWHAVEGALVALLGAVPLVAFSDPARHFVGAHPAYAAYVPVAVGVSSWLVRTLKGPGAAGP